MRKIVIAAICMFASLANAYDLKVSKTADKAISSILNGSKLDGDVYVYTTPDTDVKGVRWYIDNTAMTTQYSADWAAPFDLNPGTLPYNMSTLSVGSHTITAKISKNSTTTAEIITATFNVVAPVSKVKWYPGHYVRVTTSDITTALAKISSEPNFKGLMVVYDWYDLETSKGVYDLTRIEADLAEVKAAGKRLIIQVADKEFGASKPCVPNYIVAEPLANGGKSITYKADGTVKSCVSKRWNPYVQDRLIALYNKIATRFDTEAYIAAVNIQENAIDNAGTNREDYTVNAYIAQQNRGIDALATAFPHTIAFKWLNWGGYVPTMIEYSRAAGIGLGGPDTVPWDLTDAHKVTYQFAGKMPIQASSQSAGLSNNIRLGNVTLEQLWDYAFVSATGLNAHFMVWDATEAYPETSFANKIVPLVNSHNGYTKTACPANISCAP